MLVARLPVQIVLTDTVGKLNQPMKRLSLQRAQIRPVPQPMGCFPKFRPPVEKVDEIADRETRFATSTTRPFEVIFVGRIHARRLGHNAPCGGVKKV
jgi:hypothetical protein